MKALSTTRIGTSGWQYPDWKQVVYGSERRTDPLAFLAQHFSAVEINVSFYRDLDPGVTSGWVQRLDAFPDFRFCAKLHRRFTHDRDEFTPWDVSQTWRGLEPLVEAGRFGAFLAQFPWSFRYGPDAVRWLRRLRDAFAQVPVVVEVRHDSWMTTAAQDAMHRAGVGWCNIDQPPHPHAVPPTSVVWGPVAYVRLHGRNRTKWFEHEMAWERYDYLYTPGELGEWVPRIQQLSERAEQTYVFTNNHYRGQAFANGLQIQARLLAEAVQVPGPLMEAYPELIEIARPGVRQGMLF